MAKKIEPKKGTELTLLERIIISNILPEAGTYEYVIVKKDILAKVAVTQEELKKFEIKTSSEGEENQGIRWNKKGDEAKFNIEFHELEKNEIKLALKKASDDKKLTESMINLYNTFVK